MRLVPGGIHFYGDAPVIPVVFEPDDDDPQFNWSEAAFSDDWVDVFFETGRVVGEWHPIALLIPA
jgi:hypothetical protein